MRGVQQGRGGAGVAHRQGRTEARPNARSSAYAGEWVGFRLERGIRHALSLRLVTVRGLLAGAGLEVDQDVELLGTYEPRRGQVTALARSADGQEFECEGAVSGDTFVGRWSGADGAGGDLRLRRIRACALPPRAAG
jgi:hypothetical protein